MEIDIKKIILTTINKMIHLDDYSPDEYIYSQKYLNSPLLMIYFICQLSEDYNLIINDDFIDSLEMCTFYDLENILNNIYLKSKSETFNSLCNNLN